MDRTNIIRQWLDSGSLPSEAEFFRIFADGSGKYILDEGSTWDFKQEWPFSYSNDYWGGIAKLLCAFSNEALSLHLIAYKVYFDEGYHWSPTTFEHAKNTAYNLFGIPLQAAEPWKVFDLITDALKTDGIYADPLEEPIAESLKKTTGTTRRDLAHRFRNKMKPLEMAVRDAKWHDSAASERITKTIRSGEFILQSKHAL